MSTIPIFYLLSLDLLLLPEIEGSSIGLSPIPKIYTDFFLSILNIWTTIFISYIHLPRLP